MTDPKLERLSAALIALLGWSVVCWALAPVLDAYAELWR